MQGDDVEFELTPGMLDTPSLLTPDITLTASTNQSTYNPLHKNYSNNNENNSTSNPLSIRTTNQTSSSASSADVKVLKIEDELKQSLSEPRKPTPSPFQKISSTNVFNLDKPVPVITNDDGTAIEIPSTADVRNIFYNSFFFQSFMSIQVVKELEALTNTNPLQFQLKTLINDNNERETNTTITLNGDNIRYSSPPTVMGVTVSPPKKKFLARSQSHTEPTSPIQNNNNNNNLSQSQKMNNDNNILNTQNGLDDDNSMDDSVNNHFTRVPDLLSISNSNETNFNNNQQFKPTINNGNEQHLNLQIRTDQNGITHSMTKREQQQILINNNNKRTFQQANIGKLYLF
jgi:hypothetical protein